MLALSTWLACDGPAPLDLVPAETGADPTDTEDTGTGEPQPFEASCTLDPGNVLRAHCQASLLAPAAMHFTISPVADLEEQRVFPSEQVSIEHTAFVWGILPSTLYRWQAIDEATGLVAAGTFWTEELPEDVGELSITATAPLDTSNTQVELVLISPACPGALFVLFDVSGRIVWYQRLLDLDPSLAGVINVATWTEDRTIAAIVARSTVIEFDLEGNILMETSREEAFDSYVHHELFKRDGVFYVLRSHTTTLGESLVVDDGVYAIDSAGSVIDEFSITGLWPIVAQPIMIGGYWSGLFIDALDFSHVNSVYVEENGDIWLSFRHLGAFGKFTGGPGSDLFGQLQWIAVGNELSAISTFSDFTMQGFDPFFEGQHDVHPASDGTVLMFDNSLTPGETARGVRYALDKAAGTLTVLQSLELGMLCPVQGSVRELPGGNTLVTCASQGALREFDANSKLVWEADTVCRDILPAVSSRGVPVSW